MVILGDFLINLATGFTETLSSGLVSERWAIRRSGRLRHLSRPDGKSCENLL